MELFMGVAVLTVLSTNHFAIDDILYPIWVKRLIDISLALTALIVCLPILLTTALLVVTTSSGPVFFVQDRVGYLGRIFKIYKFRTMVENANTKGSKTECNDPRLTGLGRFLRNSKIDELPQLLNILNGEMSIIGPRPLSLIETTEIRLSGYDAESPGFFHMVRPGLIGLEQINRQVRLDYTTRFQFNRQYEDRLSFGLDMYIFITALCQCRFVCGLAVASAVLELFFMIVFLLHH